MEFMKGGVKTEIEYVFDEALKNYENVTYSDLEPFVNKIINKIDDFSVDDCSIDSDELKKRLEEYKIDIMFRQKYLNNEVMTNDDKKYAEQLENKTTTDKLLKKPDKNKANFIHYALNNKNLMAGHLHYGSDFAGFPEGRKNNLKSLDCNSLLKTIISWVLVLFCFNYDFGKRTHFLKYFYKSYQLKLNSCDKKEDPLYEEIIVEKEAKAKEDTPVVFYDYYNNIFASIYSDKEDEYNKDIPFELIRFMREFLKKKPDNFLIKKINKFLSQNLEYLDVEIYNVKINELINKYSNTDYYKQFTIIERCKKPKIDILEIQNMFNKCNEIVQTLNDIPIDNDKNVQVYIKTVLINKINIEREQLHNLLEKYNQIKYDNCKIQRMLILNELTENKIFSIMKYKSDIDYNIKCYDIIVNKNNQLQNKETINIYRQTLLEKMEIDQDMFKPIMNENEEYIIDERRQIQNEYTKKFNNLTAKKDNDIQKINTRIIELDYSHLSEIKSEIKSYKTDTIILEQINDEINDQIKNLKKKKQQLDTLKETIVNTYNDKISQLNDKFTFDFNQSIKNMNDNQMQFGIAWLSNSIQNELIKVEDTNILEMFGLNYNMPVKVNIKKSSDVLIGSLTGIIIPEYLMSDITNESDIRKLIILQYLSNDNTIKYIFLSSVEINKSKNNKSSIIIQSIPALNKKGGTKKQIYKKTKKYYKKYYINKIRKTQKHFVNSRKKTKKI